MPNIKSAKKRVLVTATKEMQNKVFKTQYKTMVKKYQAAIAAGDKATAADLYPNVIAKVDRAAARGIIAKNTAARKKSQLTVLLNRLA